MKARVLNKRKSSNSFFCPNGYRRIGDTELLIAGDVAVSKLTRSDITDIRSYFPIQSAIGSCPINYIFYFFIRKTE